jgi:L-2-hydroxyglutarate oxidase LhgO
MTDKADITIVGAGVIGCALAYELSKNNRKQVVVVEKNTAIPGENQSSRNSGVLHAGIYYDNEPLKARLCVEGNWLLDKFCEKYQVPARKTGKLVLATKLDELEFLFYLLMVSKKKIGVPDVSIISGKEAQEKEPYVKAKAALYVPTSGIIDAASLVERLYQLAIRQGAIFLPGTKLANATAKGGGFEIITSQSSGLEEKFESEYLINSAGLYADEVARIMNPEIPFNIVPTRGESAKFYAAKLPVSMNVYPVPEGYFPDGKKAEVTLEEFIYLLDNNRIARTVGVHLTPTLDGSNNLGKTVTIGPVKTLGIGKEDYGSNLKEPEIYFQKVHSFFPHLKKEDIELHQAGIMAVCSRDFVIQQDIRYKNWINLIGMESPGLTACLAIAKYVKELVK